MDQGRGSPGGARPLPSRRQQFSSLPQQPQGHAALPAGTAPITNPPAHLPPSRADISGDGVGATLASTARLVSAPVLRISETGRGGVTKPGRNGRRFWHLGVWFRNGDVDDSKEHILDGV